MTYRGGGRVQGGVSVDMGRFRYAINWADIVGAALTARMETAVEIGERTAREAVPVRTGNLQSTIEGNVQRRGPSLEGRLSVGTNYWQFVEYGTGGRGVDTNISGPVQSQGYSYGPSGGMPARPFMRPGLVAMRNSFTGVA